MTAHPPSEAPVGRLVLLRHGETAWSRSGQHTGRTDIPLTEHGEDLARAAGNLLAGHTFGLVLASPLQRAWRTAELAGLTAEREDNLVEWDYGAAEGRTTAEIRADVGYAWSAFTHGVTPGKTPGESIEEVAARMALVLARVTNTFRLPAKLNMPGPPSPRPATRPRPAPPAPRARLPSRVHPAVAPARVAHRRSGQLVPPPPPATGPG